jgi:hypothetical protein
MRASAQARDAAAGSLAGGAAGGASGAGGTEAHAAVA